MMPGYYHLKRILEILVAKINSNLNGIFIQAFDALENDDLTLFISPN